MRPTMQDVQGANPLLSDFAIAAIQSQAVFVGQKLFPPLPVRFQAGQIPKLAAGDFNRDEAKAVNPGDVAPQVGFSQTYLPYACQTDKARFLDLDEIRNNQPVMDLQGYAASQLVALKLLLRSEKLWAAAFFATGKWATEYAGVAASVGSGEFLQWNDPASTPISDVRTALTTAQLASGGFRPNVMGVSRYVFDALANHPDIITLISGQGSHDNPARVMPSTLAAIFGLEEVHILESVENLASLGIADNHGFIAGKHALLVHRAKSPDMRVPSAGYTVTWNGVTGIAGDGRTAAVKQYREEARAGDWYEAWHSIQHLQVNSSMGAFFLNAVA